MWAVAGVYHETNGKQVEATNAEVLRPSCMASAFFENMFHYNNRSNLADKIGQLENMETKKWKCGMEKGVEMDT